MKEITKTAAQQPQYYTVKIEATCPCTLTYKILAIDADQAVVKARKSKPVNIKPRLPGKRDIKATVYKFGYSIVELVMNLVGK